MRSPPSTVLVGAVAGRVYLWIGIVLAVIGVAQLLAGRPDSVSWMALAGALATGGAVAILPRATIPALLALAAAIVTMVAVLEVPVFASFVAVMIAAFTLARYSRLRAASLGYAILVGIVAVVAAPELKQSTAGVFDLIYPIFYFGGAGLLGWLTRKRAEYIASLVAYSEVLEREQSQRAELAAAAERERLARDMHDVVSHGVSLMVLQAEAAREVLYRQPDDAAVALDAIAEAGRAAMSDLHRMLGVLRGSSLDLNALAAAVRATGLTVDLRVDGNWALVEGESRVALFRVAQESLTNTMRHAAGARLAVVDVVCGPEVVAMEIVDDGKGDAGFQYTLQGFSQTQFFYGYGDYLYGVEYGFIDRDRALATQTSRGATGVGIYPLNRYSRLEMSAGIMNFNQRYEEPGLQEIADQYQTDVYGRPLFSDGNFMPLALTFIKETTVFREYGPLAGHTLSLGYEYAPPIGDFLSRQSLDGDARYYMRLGTNGVLAMRLRRYRAGAISRVTSTSAATPSCAGTTICRSSATRGSLRTPSCGSRSSKPRSHRSASSAASEGCFSSRWADRATKAFR